MQANKFMAYINCIPSLESREVLNNISATIYPHLKTNRMKEQLRKFKNAVKSIFEQPNKDLATFSNVMDRIKVNKHG